MINLAKSLDCLAQRGPDARGTYIEDLYAVGHRRLSIIDTDSRSNQPMKDETGRYVISFNGEIFNFKSIKEKLDEIYNPNCADVVKSHIVVLRLLESYQS